jgi:hypothetical protein
MAVTVPPLWPTVKATDTGIDTPFTGVSTVPGMVSDWVTGDDGAVTGVLEPLLQAVVRTIPTATRMKRFMSLFSLEFPVRQALATPAKFF